MSKYAHKTTVTISSNRKILRFSGISVNIKIYSLSSHVSVIIVPITSGQRYGDYLHLNAIYHWSVHLRQMTYNKMSSTNSMDVIFSLKADSQITVDCRRCWFIALQWLWFTHNEFHLLAMFCPADHVVITKWISRRHLRYAQYCNKVTSLRWPFSYIIFIDILYFSYCRRP